MSKEIKEFFIKMEENLGYTFVLLNPNVIITTRDFQNMYDDIIFQSTLEFYGTNRGAFRQTFT